MPTSKILIIGDTHGSMFWKKAVEEVSPKYVIFLGDYCDSRFVSHRRCIDNLKDIIEYTKQHRDNTTMLIGNHDYHYLVPNVQYSGYSPIFAQEYAETLRTCSNLLAICCEIEMKDKKYLVSHAGITNTWLGNNNLTIDHLLDAKHWSYYSKELDFNFEAEPVGGYGAHKAHGPLWVRSNQLLTDMVPEYHQIVGHTYHDEVIEHVTDDGLTLTVICAPCTKNTLILEEELWIIRTLERY